MIRYDLRCSDGHAFDSWFQSSAAYERLAEADRLSCPVCGSLRVEKALMAPALRPETDVAAPRPSGAQAPSADEVARAIAALRRQVEENSDYVGLNFAAEARAIHEGEAPGRAIYGEARADEAMRLVADGVPVAPLPFIPARKVN